MPVLMPRRVYADVYTPGLTLAGMITPASDASSLSFTEQWLGVGTGSITLPSDNRLVPALSAPGARVRFSYARDDGEVLAVMSGPVDADSRAVSRLGSTITWTVTSDDQILRNLAWPVPAADLSGQTSEHYIATGPIESVVPALIRANLVDRLGLPVRLVPTFPEGPTVTVQARFEPIVDVIKPLLLAHYRGLRVWQWMPGDQVPLLMASDPPVVPTVLIELVRQQEKPWMEWSPELGIATGAITRTAPSVTRVVVGGQGEGTARVFRGSVDAARETEWGRLAVREQFVDARDAADTATLDQRAATALAEGAPKAAVSAEAVEGDPWVVFNHYNVGDRVPIAVDGTVLATEVIQSITYTSNGREGVVVSPRIGQPSATAEPDEALARQVAAIGRRVLTIETRR